MNYCQKCKSVFEEMGRCPECNSKKIREVCNEAICLLVEKPLVLSGLLEEVLKNNGIPYMTKGTMGAGLTLTIGAFIETTKFYVTYPCFEKAKALVEEIFSADLMSDLDAGTKNEKCGAF